MAFFSKRSLTFFFFLVNLPPALMAADEAKQNEAPADAASEEVENQRRNSLEGHADLVGLISKKLAGFTMIDPNKIASAALMAPEPRDVEYGLDQVRNCLAILGVKFDKTKDYKLSFDLPVADLQNIGYGPRGMMAANGRSRLAPLPHQMADYFNQHLAPKKAKVNAQLAPKKLKAYAVSHSLSIQAGFAAFQTAVESNIEGMAPVFDYYPPVAEEKFLHFYLIVGFQKNGDGLLDKIAVLDSVGPPQDRIQIFKADTFFNKMDTSAANLQASDLMLVLENRKNKKAVAIMPGQRPSSNDLKLWGSRSYISFVKPPEEIAAKVRMRLPSFR